MEGCVCDKFDGLKALPSNPTDYSMLLNFQPFTVFVVVIFLSRSLHHSIVFITQSSSEFIKGGKSSVASDVSKGKAMAEEKGK